jgi:hypothetical protein
MRFLIAGLILMLPVCFLLGYFAGAMQDILYEREEEDEQ